MSVGLVDDATSPEDWAPFPSGCHQVMFLI